MIKKTKNNSPINALAQDRWSNRAYNPKEVEDIKLNSILEAARWAPSAFNEQPWRFIVGKNGSENFEKIFSTLGEWNQQWASKTGALILNITKKNFTHNNKPNATAQYDLGQAVAFMALETVNQGLYGHQMSGFNASEAARIFNIDDEYKIVSVFAIGHYGNPEELPTDMLTSEMAERSRKNLDKLVFASDIKVI